MSTGCYDGNIRLYNATGKCIATEFGHKQAVKALAMTTTSDGVFHVASGGKDPNVRLWQVDPSASRPLQSVALCQGHQGSVEAVALEKESHKLASASWDGTIRLWDLPGKREIDSDSGRVAKRQRKLLSSDQAQESLMTFTEHTQCVSCVKWISANVLCSGSWDHSVKLWDITKGECSTTLVCSVT